MLIYCSFNRSLSQELQADTIRLITNGTAIMKAKQVLPGMVVGGLAPRSALPGTQMPNLAGPLSNQVFNFTALIKTSCKTV